MKHFRRATLVALLGSLAACDPPAPTDLDSSILALLSAPLRPGEVESFQGRSSERIGIDPGPDGAEYLLVLSNVSTSGGQSISVTVEGAGISPAPAVAAGVPPEEPVPTLWPRAEMPRMLDGAGFHQRLREREERLVRELVGRLPEGGLSLMLEAAPQPVAVPQVGEIIELNVNPFSACTDPDLRPARVEAVSEQAIVLADLESPAGLTRADFEEIARSFDTRIFPLATANFGEPARRIGPPRTTIFYTTAVNELASDFGGLIGGFFFARDLFPRAARDGFQGCSASNEREMLYMLTADPDGRHGPAIPVDFIRRVTLTTAVHEHQHLVNSSRRLWILGTGNLEVVWLNEGLSHIAEELLFYQESGLSPGANLGLQELRAAQRILDAANAHQIQNLLRYMLYLDDPSAHSPVDPEDGLEMRGASWSFLRYLADQHMEDDAEFFFNLVNTGQQGTQNLSNRLGMALDQPLARWNLSNLADDLVPGLPGVYRQPSWNFRSLLPALRDDESFPLRAEWLEPGVPASVTVRGGSSAFLRFEVPPGQMGSLTVRAGGSSPPETARVSVVRRR